MILDASPSYTADRWFAYLQGTRRPDGSRVALVGEAGIVPRQAGECHQLARHTLTIAD